MTVIKWPENIGREINGIVRELPNARLGKIADIDGNDIGELLDSIFNRLADLGNAPIESEEDCPSDREGRNGEGRSGSGSRHSNSVNGRIGLPLVVSDTLVNTYPFGTPTNEIYDKAVFVYYEKQGERAYKKLLSEVLKYAGKAVTCSNDSNKIGTRKKTIIIITNIWKEDMEDLLTSYLAPLYFHTELCVHVMFQKENYCFQSKGRIMELPYFMQNKWFGPELDMYSYNNVLLPRDDYEVLFTNEILYRSSDYIVLISMHNWPSNFAYRLASGFYDYYEWGFQQDLFADPESYRTYAKKIENKMQAQFGRCVVDKVDGEFYPIREKSYKDFIIEIIPFLDSIKSHKSSSGSGKNYCEIRICGHTIGGNAQTDRVIKQVSDVFSKLIASTIE